MKRKLSATTQLYRHFSANGDLLYVGISLSAVARLGRHQNGAAWAREIATISVENFPTRDMALTAEAIAIAAEKPKHNISIPSVDAGDVLRHRNKGAAGVISRAPHPQSIYGVSIRLGVCRATIYNEIARGNLEVTKIGSRTIITEEQERAWLDRGRRSA